MSYYSDADAKKAILYIGKKLHEGGFVSANDGNICVRVSENEVWATPSGVNKGELREEMLVKIDLDGNLIEGTWPQTSEIKMHLRIFKECPDQMCTIHAHPLVATAFACAGETLTPDEFSEPMIILGTIPCAPFARNSTQEVPDSIAPFCKDNNCVLIGNHGAVSWGRTATEALFRMDSLERYCRVHLITKYIIGKQAIISGDDFDFLKGMHDRKRTVKSPAVDVFL